MAETLRQIAVADLMPDPSQPRKTFNSDALERLALFIAKMGVQQPLRVIWDAERKCWLILPARAGGGRPSWWRG
jgi:ParB family chromosome partitioning protein